MTGETRAPIIVSALFGATDFAYFDGLRRTHFPPERKARMEQLVKNLLASYQTSIDTLDWMSPATKREAQAKL
ncbi:MAG: M13 family metallopeptidase, partial [Sphingomonas sp.]|nr:M13 family metallopeptidase [Sphingomonas sp.]